MSNIWELSFFVVAKDVKLLVSPVSLKSLLFELSFCSQLHSVERAAAFPYLLLL